MTGDRLTVTYDPHMRRYRVTCDLCPWVAFRAKKETAEWILSQHIAYTHGGAA